MQPLVTPSFLGKWISRCTGRMAAPCQRYPLQAREQLQLKLVPGQELKCLRGSLWITQDATDMVLHSGQSVIISSRSRIYVEALEFSSALVKS